MKINKLITLVVSAIVLCSSVYGCAGKEDSSGDAGSVPPENLIRGELSDEQKKAASEVGISEERYCTNNDAISEIAEKVLDRYYEGLSEANHDKCFSAFPDFYKKAVENENKEYGDTNEEYMQSIKNGFIETYGDDFKVKPTINSVLQINDESMAALEKRINSAFGTDIVLDDLYYVYFSENFSGSLKTGENPLEFSLLCIDGEYLLYDDYYEINENSEDA